MLEFEIDGQEKLKPKRLVFSLQWTNKGDDDGSISLMVDDGDGDVFYLLSINPITGKFQRHMSIPPDFGLSLDEKQRINEEKEGKDV
ncbi:hypothetical protein KAR91_80375 [Candidatus Pacearchaeota archaeon]|nr:hypothetical protein [Candidatus Pacearchaeota archaeon]